MGKIDRSLRALVAAGAVGGSAVLGSSTPGGIVLLVVAVVMVVTAASSYCPLYSLLGINTTGSGETETSGHQASHLHRAA